MLMLRSWLIGSADVLSRQFKVTLIDNDLGVPDDLLKAHLYHKPVVGEVRNIVARFPDVHRNIGLPWGDSASAFKEIQRKMAWWGWCSLFNQSKWWSFSKLPGAIVFKPAWGRLWHHLGMLKLIIIESVSDKAAGAAFHCYFIRFLESSRASLIVGYEVEKGLGAVYLNLEPEREGELWRCLTRELRRKGLGENIEKYWSTREKESRERQNKYLNCKSPLKRRTRAKCRFLSLCWSSIPFEKENYQCSYKKYFRQRFCINSSQEFYKKSACSAFPIVLLQKLLVSKSWSRVALSDIKLSSS